MLNSHLKQFSKILKTNSKIYSDSKKLQCNTTSQLFTTLRPDIGILDGYEMTVIELTNNMFSNYTLKSREYKINTNTSSRSWYNQFQSIKVLFIEITSLGFISK